MIQTFDCLIFSVRINSDSHCRSYMSWLCCWKVNLLSSKSISIHTGHNGGSNSMGRFCNGRNIITVCCITNANRRTMSVITVCTFFCCKYWKDFESDKKINKNKYLPSAPTTKRPKKAESDKKYFIVKLTKSQQQDFP